MTLYSLDGIEPTLVDADTIWIAPDANVVGNIVIGSGVSIWFGSTLRGDNEPITIGDGSNIQENCVLHTDPGYPLVIGRECTVGHKAMLHGCKIGDHSLVGMGATILNGARLGSNCVVGACALVTENKEFPDYSLLMGTPAKVVRTLTEAQAIGFRQAAKHYQQNISRYREGLRVVDLASTGTGRLS